MKTTIITFSDWDKQFGHLVKEYTKRLGKLTTILQLKPIKYGSPKEIIEKETELLVKRLAQYENAHIVLLAHTGKSMPSEEFSQGLYKHDHTVFVIWGAFGVNEWILERSINAKISFWNQTMPHWLVKVVLLEQIRRWRTIKIGKKYHY